MRKKAHRRYLIQNVIARQGEARPRRVEELILVQVALDRYSAKGFAIFGRALKCEKGWRGDRVSVLAFLFHHVHVGFECPESTVAPGCPQFRFLSSQLFVVFALFLSFDIFLQKICRSIYHLTVVARSSYFMAHTSLERRKNVKRRKVKKLPAPAGR